MISYRGANILRNCSECFGLDKICGTVLKGIARIFSLFCSANWGLQKSFLKYFVLSFWAVMSNTNWGSHCTVCPKSKVHVAQSIKKRRRRRRKCQQTLNKVLFLFLNLCLLDTQGHIIWSVCKATSAISRIQEGGKQPCHLLFSQSTSMMMRRCSTLGDPECLVCCSAFTARHGSKMAFQVCKERG